MGPGREGPFISVTSPHRGALRAGPRRQMVWRSGHRGQDRGREAQVAQPFRSLSVWASGPPRPSLWVLTVDMGRLVLEALHRAG